MATRKENSQPQASPFFDPKDQLPAAVMGLEYATQMLVELDAPMDGEEATAFLEHIRPHLKYIVYACALGVSTGVEY